MTSCFRIRSFVSTATLLIAIVGLMGCPTSHDVAADATPTPDVPGRLDAPSIDASTGPDVTSTDVRTSGDHYPDTSFTPDTPDRDVRPSTDAPSTSSGDCDVDADCPGGACIELVPGGYRVCRTPPVEQTTCPMPSIDQCCDSADCGSGEACFLGPIVESCGGPVRLPFNECASDLCSNDGDCGTDQICAPAGTFAPVAVCVAGSCHVDADCTVEAGGRCVVARDPCCGVSRGLFCTYASDGCRTSADCATGYCAIDGVRARCVNDGGPFCPL